MNMNRVMLTIVLGLGLIAPIAMADVWDELAQFTATEADDAPPVQVEKLIAQTPAAEMGPIEDRLIALVESANATQEAKWFACRMLQRVGTEKCVPVLAGLLGDDTMSHYARLTLESMKASEAAGRALVASLETAPDHLKIGIMGSLAARGDEVAIDPIATYIGSANMALAKAATQALGRIGGKKARSAILKVPLKQVRQVNLLAASDAMRPDDAYALMMNGCNPGIRTGAFIQLAAADPTRARNALVGTLKQANNPARTALLRAAMESGDVETRDLLVAGLAGAVPADQLVLLGAIENLKLKAYEKDVIALLAQPKGKVRDAAIYALATIGGVASFEPLYGVYQEDAGQAVIFAITRLPVPSIDAALLKTVAEDADMGKRLAAMTPLMLRNPDGAIDLFNRLAGPKRLEEIRKAAYKTLESIGDVETCKVFMAAVVGSDVWRRPAQTSLKRLCVSMGKGDDIWRGAFKPALDSASDDDAREALLAVLDGAACGGALSYLKTIIKDSENTLRPAAIRSLTRWPEFDAGDVWLDVMAAEGVTPEDLEAAERGVIRVLSRDEIRADTDRKLKLAAKAVQQAQTLEFKQAVLACYDKPSGHEKRRMKELWKPLLDDTSIVEQVQALMN
ncbi:MAG: hypothetical protein ISS31_07950 [Kiritimatiellae bacterium]|nr:hypothetical protein [Kiritimatiellia bacterium]